MKRRIGITGAMLAGSLLFGLPLYHAQQGQQKPDPCNGPGLPSVPAIPAVPALPSTPALPNVPAVDPLGDVLFPPELIMRHALSIELSGEQKTSMRAEIQTTTTRFNELKWQLQEAMEVLHETMKSNSVNEGQAMSQLDKVLDVEREIKRLHIGMGIRLKNQLTPTQQTKLDGIRMARRPGGQPRPTS